jgi:voltage-gated potassium channel
MFVEILGIGVYGYLIGNIASILARKNPPKTKYLNDLKNLNLLVNIRRISRDLQYRLREYYTYVYTQKVGYDEDAILKELPRGLREELALELKKEFIDRIDLFKGADPGFIKDMALHLKPIVLIPGDILIKEGEEGDEMYFVIRGQLSVWVAAETKPIAQLSSGDFLGEIALVMNIPRTSTIKAETYCDLYVLNRNTYNYIVSKYPGIGGELKRKAAQREKSLK